MRISWASPKRLGHRGDLVDHHGAHAAHGRLNVVGAVAAAAGLVAVGGVAAAAVPVPRGALAPARW